MSKLGEVLFAAAVSDDDRRVAAARRVVEAITGGRIVVSQQREAKPKGGWLRGTFGVRLLRPLCDALGVASLDGVESDVLVDHVDFRGASPAEELADAAKALWDRDLLVKEIAAELSRARGVAVGRAMVKKALSHWFASRGLPLPDGRSRRKSLARKGVDPDLPAQIADAVMTLVDRGALYGEIADRLNVDRNTVTAAVRVWHASRGLPVPDGRTRRRALGPKSRGPARAGVTVGQPTA